MNSSAAFGGPGVPPTWTSGAKDLVTTALGSSRLWATVGLGIVNEVYWPSTGQPQVRDLGFIVAGPAGWTEVKRVRNYTVSTPAAGVPLPQVVHQGDAYRLTLEFLPDPLRDVLLIAYQLEAANLSLYPLVAPHLGSTGWGNTAWVDLESGGLFAQNQDQALCLASATPFSRASAGFVGASDGWQDFNRNGRMSYTFAQAGSGNVALMGELPGGAGVLALALSPTPEGASTLARGSLAEAYTSVRERFIDAWTAWGAGLALPASEPDVDRAARRSAAVLKVHEDRSFPGAVVASLAIPWGDTRQDLGGYHLVWTRDAVEAGQGLAAAGQLADARQVLAHLVAIQAPDGHWTQNAFPDGRPYWTGVQLDEVGFPILLAARLAELGVAAVGGTDAMVRAAAAYLAQNGPVSPQDRWEENQGVSPFTLAVEVAALVAASDRLGPAERDYALGLADYWNERIEDWTYARGTAWAQRFGVDGHYLRVAPTAASGGLRGRVEIRNRSGETIEAEMLVGLDFLYLVRLGLRDASDPRIQASVRVVDGVLGVGLPCGTVYHRYNEDGYGEHADGSPFDGTGIGRAWPLLVGERAHFDLASGQDPLPALRTLVCLAHPGGLLPEQVWDQPPVPARGLVPGGPTGSAMPLVWAHAELLKLLIARSQGHPVERLEAVWGRYGGVVPRAMAWYWRTNAPFDTLPSGRGIVVEDSQPFVLHTGFDGWQDVRDLVSAPLGLGMHGVQLETNALRGHALVNFTRYSVGRQAWEGVDHVVQLG